MSASECRIVARLSRPECVTCGHRSERSSLVQHAQNSELVEVGEVQTRCTRLGGGSGSVNHGSCRTGGWRGMRWDESPVPSADLVFDPRSSGGARRSVDCIPPVGKTVGDLHHTPRPASHHWFDTHTKQDCTHQVQMVATVSVPRLVVAGLEGLDVEG